MMKVLMENSNSKQRSLWQNFNAIAYEKDAQKKLNLCFDSTG